MHFKTCLTTKMDQCDFSWTLKRSPESNRNMVLLFGVFITFARMNHALWTTCFKKKHLPEHSS